MLSFFFPSKMLAYRLCNCVHAKTVQFAQIPVNTTHSTHARTTTTCATTYWMAPFISHETRTISIKSAHTGTVPVVSWHSQIATVATHATVSLEMRSDVRTVEAQAQAGAATDYSPLLSLYFSICWPTSSSCSAPFRI